MDSAELASIQQLYSLYGYVMDDRDWPRLAEVFTPDCVFDATALGVPLMTGVAEIEQVSSTTPQAPIAHHVTNVLVQEIDGDAATVRAKAIGIYSRGRAFSGEYRDALVRTPEGWRIKHRVNRPLTR